MTRAREFCVFFLDYGNVEWVGEARVRPLDPRFLAYPPMALPARLARLKPAGSLACSCPHP